MDKNTKTERPTTLQELRDYLKKTSEALVDEAMSAADASSRQGAFGLATGMGVAYIAIEDLIELQAEQADEEKMAPEQLTLPGVDWAKF